MHDERHAGQSTPDDEVPTGTVPQPGDEEDDEHIESPAFCAAATQREVDVIGEPLGE